MKVIVYGAGKAPPHVRRVQTAQVEDELSLCGLVRALSGGEFAIVILSQQREASALRAACVARPRARVVLAHRGALQEVVGTGQYRPYPLPY